MFTLYFHLVIQHKHLQIGGFFFISSKMFYGRIPFRGNQICLNNYLAKKIKSNLKTR